MVEKGEHRGSARTGPDRGTPTGGRRMGRGGWALTRILRNFSGMSGALCGMCMSPNTITSCVLVVRQHRGERRAHGHGRGQGRVSERVDATGVCCATRCTGTDMRRVHTHISLSRHDSLQRCKWDQQATRPLRSQHCPVPLTLPCVSVAPRRKPPLGRAGVRVWAAPHVGRTMAIVARKGASVTRQRALRPPLAPLGACHTNDHRRAETLSSPSCVSARRRDTRAHTGGGRSQRDRYNTISVKVSYLTDSTITTSLQR